MVFLSSGVITGVGPHFAQQMATLFGDQLIYILDKDPQQLNKINGIGSKKIEGIVASWHAHRQQLSFLQYIMQFDITVQLGKRIWSYYHDDAMQLCQTNPYQMIRDIRGMTFQMADRIAMDQPDLRHSSVRFNAVIDDIFYAYHQTANVWMKGASFLDQVMQRLDIDSDVLDGLVQQHVLAQDLVWITDDDQHQWVTLPHLSHGECRIMDEVQQLYDAKATIDIQPQVAVDWVQGRGQFELSLDQVSALEGVLSHSVSILYGGPGTGKTTLLNAYVQIVSKKTTKIVCMAPTGKAAKRLAQQIGRRASTIHSMMDYDESSHALIPKLLDCDVCIIDEMSMVDMALFQDILTMIQPGVRLVLVGDPDQLPSIGPGQVFKDMIQRSLLPAYQLHTNHRQVTHRGIVMLAHHILKRQPLLTPLGDDVTLISQPNADHLSAQIKGLFLDQAPRDHACSIHDIQLLIPLHKGRFGIHAMNEQLASQIRHKTVKNDRWAVGDRVMQCRNNYSKHVMNGDIGFIRSIEHNEIVIQFDGLMVTYDYTDMEDIRLAYAVSVHKFQGSEAPIIILPIIRQWKFFMSMDVLYTAVTRAKHHLYVVGELDTFNDMIAHSKLTQRLTQLWR